MNGSGPAVDGLSEGVEVAAMMVGEGFGLVSMVWEMEKNDCPLVRRNA